ncbi:MAG: cytochrome controlling protein rane protein-like protein [Ramlibacter sp.]|nr:cytochrome controlling protein rane protein-like protein [Ramlibacter sp.]
MNPQPLYDLSPALRVMLMGVVIALGPLAWVWLRNPRAAPARRLPALTLLTLFLTFDLVLFGAFTRLTDSGLGCPDWPGCYGNASPSGAHAEIGKAQEAMPAGPVTHGKAWIEMIHRYLATGVGVLVLTLTAATWLQRKRGAPVNPWWPAATLAWVCLQGAFGALTVTMKLFPAIVTLHLLGGMVMLALLCRQAVSYEHAQRGDEPVPIAPAARAWLVAGTAVLWLQIALGGWVSTNYAVLACSDFPTCQGSWWPPMQLQGFELWRELGKSGAGAHLDFAALTAIHYAHRLFAYVVLAVLGLVAWQLHRGGELRKQAGWIAALVLWQVATGLSNVVLGWPLVAAVSHTGGAAALVVVLTWTLCESRPAPAARSAGIAARELSA